MFFRDKHKRDLLGKWLIGVVAVCILFYLAMGNLNILGKSVLWVVNLLLPLILGAFFALVFNVPMGFIERHLFPHAKRERVKRLRRPLAILLSILLVFGIFVGVAFLVIPQLAGAIKLLSTQVLESIDHLSQLESEAFWASIPFGDTISRIEIDWVAMQSKLETWALSTGSNLMDGAINAAGSFAGTTVDAFIGLVFAIYILANKETLKRQGSRLIHAWLPQRVGGGLLHVATVCSRIFRSFVAGQVTEAFILGFLCFIGMLLLGLPYAAMIGALVGVSALIPIVGAFIGMFVGIFMILTVSPLKALIFAIFLLVLQQVEGNLIYPKVGGSKMNLPGLWVLAAITIGGELAGPIGMLLGVPAFSALYTLLKEATANREAALAAKSEDTPEETA